MVVYGFKGYRKRCQNLLVFGRTWFPWKVYPHHFVFCLLKYLCMCMCMCLIIQCIYKFTLYITYWIILYWPKLNSFFFTYKAPFTWRIKISIIFSLIHIGTLLWLHLKLQACSCTIVHLYFSVKILGTKWLLV